MTTFTKEELGDIYLAIDHYCCIGCISEEERESIFAKISELERDAK